ncbi:hypothetical protein HAX54_027227 [Datura stramonium]|uniref:Uncharacterized protein n=1 Tax=Datura stramonium TaxID=4076 RepID=A0ABS8S8L2_DATST|nr:hypothetical protein [Datura stramonium]
MVVIDRGNIVQQEFIEMFKSKVAQEVHLPACCQTATGPGGGTMRQVYWSSTDCNTIWSLASFQISAQEVQITGFRSDQGYESRQPSNGAQVHKERAGIEADGNGVDEIELLMQLLGLSDRKSEGSKRVEMDLGCDDAFYGKIVGVKGPKSEKEVERKKVD